MILPVFIVGTEDEWFTMQGCCEQRTVTAQSQQERAITHAQHTANPAAQLYTFYDTITCIRNGNEVASSDSKDVSPCKQTAALKDCQDM